MQKQMVQRNLRLIIGIIALLLSTLPSVRCSSCFGFVNKFPQVLGGQEGLSLYNAIELSPISGYIAVGGASIAQDFIQESGAMAFASLLDQTASYKWTYRLWSSIQTTVTSIAFKPDESEVIVVMGMTSAPFAFQRLYFTNGVFIQGYVANQTQSIINIQPSSALVLSSNLYISLLDSSSNAYLIGLDLASTGTNLNSFFFLQSESSPSFINRIFSNNGSSAVIVTGSFTLSSGPDLYQMSVFSINPTTGSQYGLNYLTAASDSQTFQPQDTLYYSNSSQGQIFMTALQTAQQQILYFIQMQYDNDFVSNLTSYNVFYHDFGNTLSTDGMYLDISTPYYKLYTHVYSNFVHSIVMILISGSVSYSISQKILSPLSNQVDIFFGARFWTPTESFYIFQFLGANNLDGTTMSSQFDQAGVMSQSYTYSCLSDSNTFTYLLPTPVSKGTVRSIGISQNPIKNAGSYQLIEETSPGNVALNQTIIQQTWCYHSVSLGPIPSSYPASYTYQVYDYAADIDSLAPFVAVNSIGGVCSDASFYYSVQYNSNSSALQSPWTFQSLTPEMMLQNLTESDAGTYSFTITGVLGQDTSVSGTASLTITVVNPCVSETVTAAAVPAGTYYLGSSPLTLNFSNYFTVATSQCQRTYAVYSDSSCTTLANSTLFSFNNSTGILTINQSNTALAGTYNLYVKASMTLNAAASAVASYTVTLSPCLLSTISATAAFATNYNYVVGSSQLLINYGTWTDNYAADCGAVTLAITFAQNSSAVPQTSGFAITDDTTQTALKVYTPYDKDAKSYVIDFKGKLGTYDVWLNLTTTVNILIPCIVSVSSSNFPPMSYKVNTSPYLTYQFSDFTTSNCLSSSITYSVTYDGSSTRPSWVYYDSYSKTFIVYPITNTHAGTHIITVTGTVQESNGQSSNATVNWKVTIIPDNYSPPFMTYPQDQKVQVGETVEFSLTGISDPDGEKVSISVDLGDASNFVHYDKEKFTISPTSNSDVGSYLITVTLTDISTSPLSSDYLFLVTVTAEKKSSSTSSSSSSSTSSSSVSTFQGVTISKPSNNATASEMTAYQEKMMLYQNFGAKLLSMSETGLVKIQFLDAIIVPNISLSLLNDSYLDVTAITNIYNDASNDKFTWSATYIDQYYLELQANFDSPLLVSLYVFLTT